MNKLLICGFIKIYDNLHPGTCRHTTFESQFILIAKQTLRLVDWIEPDACDAEVNKVLLRRSELL